MAGSPLQGSAPPPAVDADCIDSPASGKQSLRILRAAPSVRSPFLDAAPPLLSVPPLPPGSPPKGPTHSRPGSAASGFDPTSRSASSLERRRSLPLERALSSMQRPGAASEPRTLLPGISLRIELPCTDETEATSEAQGSDSEDGQPSSGRALTVLTTPKGMDLRDALSPAPSILERELSLTLPFGPVQLAHRRSSTAASDASSWGAGASPTFNAGADPAARLSSARSDHGSSPWQSFAAHLSHALPASPQAKVARVHHTPPRPSLLQLPPDEAFTPPGGPTLSPGPPITPGGPSYLPVEARAHAAQQLWPTLAPFIPRILRDDILLPPDARRFISFHLPPAPDQGASPNVASQTPQPSTAAGTQPLSCPMPAAVVLADISGFTALTEVLSREGPGGVELLARCMNSYFAQVIDLVLVHGGDVSKFAGDAMIVVFVATAAEQRRAEEAGGCGDGGLREATRRAAVCGQEMARWFGVMSMHLTGEVHPVPRDQVVLVENYLEWVPPPASPAGSQGQPGRASGPAAALGASALALWRSTPLRLPAAHTPRWLKAGMTPFRKKLRPASTSAPDLWVDWEQQKERSEEEHEEEGPDGFYPGRGFTSARPASETEAHELIALRRRRPTPSRFASMRGGQADSSPALGRMAQTEGAELGEDAEERAQRVRSMHERALASLAAQYTGVAKSVRPPELPHWRPTDEASSRGLSGQDRTSWSSPTSPSHGASSHAGPAGPFHTAFAASSQDGQGGAQAGSSPAAASPSDSSFGGFAGLGTAHVRPPAGQAQDHSASETASQLSPLAGNSFTSCPDTQPPLPPPRLQVKASSLSPKALHALLPTTRLPSGTSSVSTPARVQLQARASARDSGTGPGWSVRRLLSAPFGRRGAGLLPGSGGPDGGASAALSGGSGTSSQPSHPSQSAFSLSLAARHVGLRSARSAPCSPLHTPPDSPIIRASLSRGGSLTAQGDEAAAVEAHQAAPPEQALLSIKLMLTAGQSWAYRVGGGMETAADGTASVPRWEFFLADSAGGDGPLGPIAQLAVAERHATPGEVIASAEAAALLGDAVPMQVLPGGAARLLHDDGAAAAVSPQEAGLLTGRVNLEAERLRQLPADAQIQAYQILRSHVPLNVRRRVEAGHIDYVNELRVATMVFLGFSHLGTSATVTGVGPVQEVARCVQEHMQAHGGILLQMRADEKGFLSLCAFGLPGQAHEDSPARGVRSALAIVRCLQGQGVEAVGGVTTGNLFCAVVGSQRRAEYSVFGGSINLAARLMVHAGGGAGAVVCDEPTRWLAAGKVRFEPLPGVAVKGRAAPVTVFHVLPLEDAWVGQHPSPLAPALSALYPSYHPPPLPHTGEGGSSSAPALPLAGPPPAGDSPSVAAFLVPLIGRDDDLGRVASRLAALVDGRGGGGLFLEGQVGMGKTRLVKEVASGPGLDPLRQRCVVLVGVGLQERQTQALWPWRRIFRQVFLADDQRSRVQQARKAAASTPSRGGGAGGDAAQAGAGQHASQLALRLRDALPEYAAWRGALAAALGLPLEALPVALNATDAPASAPPIPFTDPTPESANNAGRAGVERQLGASLHQQALPEAAPPSIVAANPPQHMNGAQHAQHVQHLLVAILREFSACHGPLLVILDDCHLFDTASWQLLLRLLDEAPAPALVVATLRPVLSAIVSTSADGAGEVVADAPGAATDQVSLPGGFGALSDPGLQYRLGGYYEEALWRHGSERLVLQPFTPDQARDFVAAALGGAAVNEAAACLLWEKSAGLPAYLQQATIYLRLAAGEAGAARGGSPGAKGLAGGSAGAEAQAAPGPKALARMGMDFVRATVNVHSIVPAHLDRLRPDEQLTLKVASVMGATVHADLLAATHPLQPSTSRVERALRALRAAGFLQRSPADAPGVWRFRDVLVRDVIYDLIPLGQRRAWHARLAAAMERRGGVGDRDRGALPPGTLAYHWTQACEGVEGSEGLATLKAVACWERAAADAAAGGAHAEGAAMLQLCITLAEALAEQLGPASAPLVPRWRRARWERCCAAFIAGTGPAHDASHDHSAALVRCLRALALLGVPMPWSPQYHRTTKGLAAAKEVVGRAWAAVGGWRRRQRPPSSLTIDDALAQATADLVELSALGSVLAAPAGASSPEADASSIAKEAAREGVSAMEMLVWALLAGQADADSVRYAVWVCKGLGGGRVRRGSALQNATYALQRKGVSGAAAGLPLAAMQEAVARR